MHQVIVDSINRVDLDLRKSLFSNIVLSGGSTLCKGQVVDLLDPMVTHRCSSGFGDRLLNEVKKLALKDVKIKIYAPPERKYSTWIGGSILAGLNTFKKVRPSFLAMFVVAKSPPLDVGFSRGVPGRPRYYPQKVWYLIWSRLIGIFHTLTTFVACMSSIPFYSTNQLFLLTTTDNWLLSLYLHRFISRAHISSIMRVCTHARMPKAKGRGEDERKTITPLLLLRSLGALDLFGTTELSVSGCVSSGQEHR